MADKRNRWLDRKTAERLLRGESPDNAVDGAAAQEAERLARTLAALAAPAAEPLPADEELPGEAAALAAFRKAHADRADLAGRTDLTMSAAGLADGAEAAGRPRAVPAADAGLVRIGGRVPEDGRRTRWSRPARLGLAAALAAGMVSGIAAGAGVLPTPFDGAGPARPVASVSPAVPPEGPLVAPSPDVSGADTGSAAPDTGTGGTGREDAGGGTSDDSAPDARGGRPSGVTSSCRDLNAGRTLDTERRLTLERLAGGPTRVSKYCAGVLGGTPGGNSRGDDRTGSGTAGRGTGMSQGTGTSPDDRGGRDGDAGDKGASGGGGSDDDDDRGHDRGGRGGGGGGGGHDGDGHGDGRDGGGSGGSGGSGHSGGSGRSGGSAGNSSSHHH